MTRRPNLYEFATKELAQDATLAYVLAWAHRDHAATHPSLHQLGNRFLWALLDAYSSAPTVGENCTLRVKTQEHRIDVLALVNDDIVLLIEDKVETDEHSNQIERYVETAKRKYPDRAVVPIYLKTGTASKASLPPKEKCGRFLRRDLLDVLREFPDTGDTIVDNFREHLEHRECRTQAYRTMPPCEWRWRQCEGFYADLEELLQPLDPHWGYTHNPAGGFLYFAFGGSFLSRDGHDFSLYLQIEQGVRLTVRLRRRRGAGPKVRVKFMYDTLRQLRATVSESDDFAFSKAGTFRGGKSAAVADVGFGAGEALGYLALNANGQVDIDATAARLRRVSAVVGKLAAGR